MICGKRTVFAKGGEAISVYFTHTELEEIH